MGSDRAVAAIREAIDERERRLKAPMRLADELNDFIHHVDWHDAGPDSDPNLRMLSGFAISRCEFHVEAIRVVTDHTSGDTMIDADARESEEFESLQDNLEELIRVFVGEGGFQTMKMNGKEYAIFVYPASRR